MKRFFLLGVSLVALTWVTGCCHTCHNQCVGWDDGCCADSCGDQGSRWKLKRCRHKDRCCRDNACAVGGCDTGCCDGGMSSGGQGLPGYDTGNLTGGGCSACSGGVSNYGGIPIDPSSGWQVVPNSTTGGSEPTPAPAAGSSGAGLSPMPSSAPIPPPPVSYHTLK